MVLIIQAADREEHLSSCIRSEGDLFLNGAQAPQQGPENVFKAHEFYPTWTMESPSDALREIIQICSGWKNIQRPSDVGIVR